VYRRAGLRVSQARGISPGLISLLLTDLDLDQNVQSQKIDVASFGKGQSVQILSGRGVLGFLAAIIIFLVLLAIGLHPLLALLIGGLVGPLLTGIFLKDLGDRLEHWLTTYK
jgi:hypothetical protein